MNKSLYILLIIIQLLQANYVKSQEVEAYEINKQVYYGNSEVVVTQFYPELLKAIVLKKLNEQRVKRGFESLENRELFDSVGQIQAKYMAKIDLLTNEQKGKLKTIQKRAEKYGASGQITEMIYKFAISSNNTLPLTYSRLAENIVFKWYNSLKSERLLNNPNYIFCGFGIDVNTKSRKLYFSLIMGNYESINQDKKKLDSLSVKFNHKKYGLKSFDAKACRKITSYKAIEDLHEGIKVENRLVYFESDNLKQIRRLIRHKKDAITADVVLKEQFPCNSMNIIDYNSISKGMLLKKVNAPQLYRNNQFPDRKENRLKTLIGELPNGLKDDYELNLVFIKNKHVCADINQSFTLTEKVDYHYPLLLVADSITRFDEEVYKPIADTSILSFIIPFEQKKYSYKRDDIEPILKLLNEPDFIINELTIYAFTSIEGSDKENLFLQKQRAESIVNALKNRQKDDIVSQIITDYNWSDFKRDIKGTKYEFMLTMTLGQARKYIKENNLENELEPILCKHRFARVEMKVIYDLSDSLEENYVVRKFNESIFNNDKVEALAIQKYIFRKILQNKYTENSIYNQNIPNKPDFAGLLMNQLWLKKYIEHKPIKQYKDKIQQLHELDPKNEYILFNSLVCRILFDDFIDEKKIGLMQNEIDGLYYSSFSKPTIDVLNMEFQFKVLDSVNRFKNRDKIIERSLNHIRNIYEVNSVSENEALKIANYFIVNKDYEFAIKILSPFVKRSIISEPLLFTYIALCSHSLGYSNTKLFQIALEKAKEINHMRLCELFKGEKFSFQIFQNPNIKEFVCNTCFEY